MCEYFLYVPLANVFPETISETVIMSPVRELFTKIVVICGVNNDKVSKPEVCLDSGVWRAAMKALT